jgi:hypothetical protein
MPSWARRRSLSVLARSRSWDAASNWLASRAPVALGESICCRCRDKADLETRNCPATARTVPPASKAASIALTCSFAQIEHLVTAVAHHPVPLSLRGLVVLETRSLQTFRPAPGSRSGCRRVFFCVPVVP